MITAIAVFTAAAFAGAALGALVSYGVSRCFDNPNAEAHEQRFGATKTI